MVYSVEKNLNSFCWDLKRFKDIDVKEKITFFEYNYIFGKQKLKNYKTKVVNLIKTESSFYIEILNNDYESIKKFTNKIILKK